jgi:hypothetical protein
MIVNILNHFGNFVFKLYHNFYNNFRLLINYRIDDIDRGFGSKQPSFVGYDPKSVTPQLLVCDKDERGMLYQINGK